MRPLLSAILVAGAGFTQPTTAIQTLSDLAGTWTTKSNSTITGPPFYNPSTDRFTEPKHPGISYSFTPDGTYESAYYRAVANPTKPECASALLQYQHGALTFHANASLTLSPLPHDGRQLTSNPCVSRKAVYGRYNQTEFFAKWSAYTDPYHGVMRLDLYQFNGAPLPPLYLVSRAALMNPVDAAARAVTGTGTGGAATAVTGTGTGGARLKRSLEYLRAGAQELIQTEKGGDGGGRPWLQSEKVWWFGVGMTGLGSVLYFCV